MIGVDLAGGLEYDIHDTQQHFLGTWGSTPDGRLFRYAQNGAAALAPGKLVQSVAPVAHHTNIACNVARAVGATAISATDGGTGGAIDLYTEGYVHVNDEAGEGIYYPIASAWAQGAGAAHALFASGAVATVNLAPGVTVKTALVAATSEISLTANQFDAVIIHPSPNTARIVGCPIIDVTISYFFWAQVAGPCAVLTDQTVVIGQHVRASDGVDGAVEPLDRDGTAEDEQEVGSVIKVNADTEYALIHLNLL
jgi:hypothetical protein